MTIFEQKAKVSISCLWSAFLAYDADGDGRITSGKELFGNHTVAGASNGFAALRKLSGARGGGLNANHAFFARLLLWTDANHNGVSEPSELRPFGDLFQEIAMGYTLHNRRDGHGNLFRIKGFVLAKSPKPIADLTPQEHQSFTRAVYDVFFVRQ